MVISYDSKYAVAIGNKGDMHYEILGFSLTTYEEVFSNHYDGDYLKMSLIEQNDKGNVFSVCYQDSGKFYVNFIDNKGEIVDNLDVTELLDIDEKSKALPDFYEPMMSGAFLPDDTFFI